MKPQDLQNILFSLSCFIEDNFNTIVDLERTDFKVNSVFDVNLAKDICNFYAGAARSLVSSPQNEYYKTCTSSIRYEPKGHCLGVVPWNYPLVIAMWKVAPAIAAGCTIDLKLNPKNEGSVRYIFNNWKNKVKVNIVDDVVFDYYDFIDVTGSKTTADYFKMHHSDVSADVGGASIAIVNDGNLDFISEQLSWSIKYNGGADCTSPKHVFCNKTLINDLIKKIDCIEYKELGDIDHFLPKASVSSFDSIEKLTKTINQLPNRLGLHLYTKELKVQRYISQHARWGNIFVNKPMTTPVEMPHSGLGVSGNTFNQSINKIYQYLVPKHIVVGDQDD